MPKFPYYKQSIIGTCGPACLLMHLKDKKPEQNFGRFHEFRIWFDAWLIPFGMTESYGLAKCAMKHGLKPIVIKEHQDFMMSLPKNWKFAPILKPVLSYMSFKYKRVRNSALRMGIEEKNATINSTLVKQIIDSNKKPIVMVDQSKYAWDANYPDGVLHWVVVTGYDKDGFIVNDPDMEPEMKLSNKAFEDAIDLSNFGTDRRLVIL